MAPLRYVYALKFYCTHDMHFMPRAGIGAVRGEFFCCERSHARSRAQAAENKMALLSTPRSALIPLHQQRNDASQQLVLSVSKCSGSSRMRHDSLIQC